jgi:hypothetical protein
VKIVFNLHTTGLGNNGGSRTLVKCADNLAQLGHEVLIYSNYPSKYTWTSLGAAKFHLADKPPACDVAIATGYHSVKNTLATKADKKFYYIRGYELWVTNEQNLVRSFKALNCIVNSEWLQAKFKSHGVDAHLVYPGIDGCFHRDNDNRSNAVGGLYSSRHKTKNHDVVMQVANGYDLRMLNRDIVDPDEVALNRWYNNLKVWVSPSELEGLHNPPMEASLSGCALVCTDHERGGTADYAKHLETAMIYPHGDLKMARNYVRMLMTDENMRCSLNANMIKLLKTKIGTRQDNMRKMAEIFAS